MIVNKRGYAIVILTQISDPASAIKDQNYHLVSLKNNGGLVIPSEWTVRVVRAAEWVIRQASASCRQSQPIKLLEIMYIVQKRIGSEDVFELGEHIGDKQYGIDSHHHMLLTLVVSLFFKLRLHHSVKMTILILQSNNMRQKINKQSFSKDIRFLLGLLVRLDTGFQHPSPPPPPP